MRIAIDARWIYPTISGMGLYTRELIRELALIDRKNSYLLLFCDRALREREDKETGFGAAPNFSTGMVRYGLFSIAGQVQMPGFLRDQGIHLFHSTGPMLPLMAFPRHGGPIRCVVTIHDVIPMIFRRDKWKSRRSQMYQLYRLLMLEMGRRASVILTVSQCSRNDIITHLQIPRTQTPKVKTVYCGASDRFKPGALAKDGLAKTVLYVGRSDPYKNVITLVRAFAEAQKCCKFPILLKIVGSEDLRYPQPRELARQLGIEKSVKWTGYLSDEERLQAYRQADLLVHPSRYEGFGLTPLEAMACGIPVISSNASALPEVLGDAAILLDPNDTMAFATHIVRVLSDDALAHRMSEQGLRRAGCFTWRQTAQEILAVYESLAASW